MTSDHDQGSDWLRGLEKECVLAVHVGEQGPPGCHRLGRVIAAGQAQFGPLDLNREVECVSGEVGPPAERSSRSSA